MSQRRNSDTKRQISHGLLLSLLLLWVNRKEEEHDDRVESAAEEHKNMEDLMHPKVSFGRKMVFEDKEENTECVGDTATRQQNEHDGGEIFLERGEGDEDKPTHDEVEEGREDGRERPIGEFDGGREESESPYHAKE